MPRKPTKLDLVAVEMHTVATFSYDLLQADNYRHTKKGKWIAEKVWQETYPDESGECKFVEEVVDNMIYQLLGTDAIEESCFHPMAQWVRVDMTACKRSVEQVRNAIVVIVAHVLAGKPVHSDGEPYVVNQSGNPNYWDPKMHFRPFLPPLAAKEALATPKRKR